MLSQVTIIGRICHDLELRQSAGETPYTRITIAENYHVNGKNLTMFYKCISFRESAEYVSKNIKKGDLVMATGTFIGHTIHSYSADRKEVSYQTSIPMIKKIYVLSRPKNNDEFVIEEDFNKIRLSEDIPSDIKEIINHG